MLFMLWKHAAAMKTAGAKKGRFTNPIKITACDPVIDDDLITTTSAHWLTLELNVLLLVERGVVSSQVFYLSNWK